MSSSYQIQNLVYTGNLSRPGTSKGTLLVNNGNIFALESVGTNNQVLTADSTTSTGVAWGNNFTPGNVLSLSSNNFISGGILNDTPGSTQYGGMPYGWGTGDISTAQLGTIISSDTTLRNYSLRGINVSLDFVTNFSDVTNGTLDFTLGRISPGDVASVANWTPYNLTPDIQIDDTYWDSDPNLTISATGLDIAIGAGDLVTWKFENNYTTSGPGFSFNGPVTMTAVFFNILLSIQLEHVYLFSLFNPCVLHAVQDHSEHW